MGTSLINTTPSATYPALIKVGNNTSIDGALKVLSDGAGNDLPVQVSNGIVNFTGNVGINTPAPTARLHIKGSGSTNATTSLLVQNSVGTNVLSVLDGGLVSFHGLTILNVGTAFISTVSCSQINTSGGEFGVMVSSTATGDAKFFKSVSIGTSTNPVASAVLELVSTTKGFLPPRMTTAQKVTLAATATAGLMIYDTNLNKLCVYTGAAFETITSV